MNMGDFTVYMSESKQLPPQAKVFMLNIGPHVRRGVRVHPCFQIRNFLIGKSAGPRRHFHLYLFLEYSIYGFKKLEKTRLASSVHSSSWFKKKLYLARMFRKVIPLGNSAINVNPLRR